MIEKIENVLRAHRIVREFTDERHREGVICACGTKHPKWPGHFPTHERHLAEKIAEALP